MMFMSTALLTLLSTALSTALVTLLSTALLPALLPALLVISCGHGISRYEALTGECRFLAFNVLQEILEVHPVPGEDIFLYFTVT